MLATSPSDREGAPLSTMPTRAATMRASSPRSAAPRPANTRCTAAARACYPAWNSGWKPPGGVLTLCADSALGLCHRLSLNVWLPRSMYLILKARPRLPRRRWIRSIVGGAAGWVTVHRGFPHLASPRSVPLLQRSPARSSPPHSGSPRPRPTSGRPQSRAHSQRGPSL